MQTAHSAESSSFKNCKCWCHATGCFTPLAVYTDYVVRTEEDLIPYIPVVKKPDVALEVNRPTKRISDAPDTSSQELVRSNR